MACLRLFLPLVACALLCRRAHVRACLQALATCGFSPDDVWCESFLAAARLHLPSMPPSQLAALLTVLVSLEMRPSEAWLRSFFTACPARGLRGLAPAAWPGLISALSSLKLRPDPAWLREMYAACGPVLPRMGPGQLADLATAAAGEPDRESLYRDYSQPGCCCFKQTSVAGQQLRAVRHLYSQH